MRPVGLAGVMGGQDTEVDRGDDRHLHRGRELRPAAHASHASARRTVHRRELSLRARRRHRRSRRARSSAWRSSSSRSPGARSERPPVDLYAGDPPPRPLVLRIARVCNACSACRSSRARIAALLRERRLRRRRRRRRRGGARHRADAGDATSSRRSISSRRSRDCTDTSALPDEIRPYRPGTSTDAPLWTMRRAAARRALRRAGCSRRGRSRSSPAATSTCACSIRSAENEAHLRRTLLESLARRAEFNLVAHAGQHAAVRDRLGVRAGRSAAGRDGARRACS